MVDGIELKAGQIAFQMLNSANRDSDFFDNPDSVNFRRQANKHLGFGLGAHYCVGAPLSRIEATIVLESLIERFSDIRLLSTETKWNITKRNSRVLESLNISLS